MQTAADEITEREAARKEKAKVRIRAWREIPGNRERGRRNHREWLAKPGNLERKKSADRKRGQLAESKRKKNEVMRRLRSTPEHKAKRRVEAAEYYKRPSVQKRQKKLKKIWRKKPESQALQRGCKVRRRAMEQGAGVGDPKIIAKWEAAYRSRKRVACYWCARMFVGADCHTDHVQPLSKGGAHAIDNLCIACQSCNLHKHAKALDVWNQSLVQPVLL